MLGTIKLPHNLKQLNRGLLPKSNYEEPEKIEEGGNSHYTENPSAKRRAKVEYESKLNYESDNGDSKTPKKADVRQQRAQRYRDSS